MPLDPGAPTGKLTGSISSASAIMTDSPDQPDSPFWGFTLAIYGKPGVSPAVIGLQDRHGLDVNFLLFALFAGGRGRALAAADFAALEAAAAPWRANVIHPLRAVRRWLREQDLIPVAASDPLRKAVLGREIEAEEQQQRLMEATLSVEEGQGGAEAGGAEAGDAQAGAGNLATYLAWKEIAPGAEDKAALATLLAQAFEPLAPEAAAALLQARLG